MDTPLKSFDLAYRYTLREGLLGIIMTILHSSNDDLKKLSLFALSTFKY